MVERLSGPNPEIIIRRKRNVQVSSIHTMDDNIRSPEFITRE